AFMLGFRDPELNVQKPISLDYFQDVCSRPPAWWQIKRKKTRDWTGGGGGRSTPREIVDLLTPFYAPAELKKHAQALSAISAFLLTVESPKYPFATDAARVARGREVFAEHCVRCHGTYGPDGKYPNKIVPLDALGTDPVLAEAISGRNMEHYNKTWFAQEM